MEKYRSVAVWLLLVGIVGVYAEIQIVREHEIANGPARNDNKIGFSQQVESQGVPKSRVARLTPLDRPSKMPTSKQLASDQRQRQRELEEQRVENLGRVGAANERQFGRQWEMERVQRENIDHIVTRLRAGARLAQERRDQERGAEEIRRLHNNEYPYHRP